MLLDKEISEYGIEKHPWNKSSLCKKTLKCGVNSQQLSLNSHRWVKIGQSWELAPVWSVS